MNQNAQMVDESLVDLETGEVVDAFELGKTTIIEDLPRYARALRAMEFRVGMIEKYRADETERIQAICDAKVSKFKETHHFLTTIAQGMMKESDKERLEYPGLGTFRFGQTRESVNDDAYNAGDDFGKETIAKQHPSLFVTKKTVRPDKKAIKAELKAGREIPGFSLNRTHETFTFKVEK